jgi:hypothetical protein
MARDWKGSVTQDGVVVASVIGADRVDVARDALHYAMVFDDLRGNIHIKK